VRRLSPRSVRARTTLAAAIVTALVLALASVLIVRLVERDLEANARDALTSQLESASHTAGGESVEQGGGTEGSEGGDGEVERGEDSVSESSGETGTGSGNDAQQQAIADASVAEVRAGVDAASQALLLIVPAVVALLAAAIWLTVGRALRPVHAISTRVAEISGSTLDGRVPEPQSGDEIEELARLVNQMLARLQIASQRQRDFVADASHELRSPLSTIVAAAEIAEVSSDPRRLQKLAVTVGSEAKRMQALIADLLDLARLDEDRQRNDVSLVDMTTLCRDVIGRIDAPGKDLTLTSRDPVEVLGVGSQLERLLFNVIDNAATYATVHVVVSALMTGANAEIVVEDDGLGIPEADRMRVFDRLVRLDESRERRSGGTGIGLALVKTIIDRHHGMIEVDVSPSLGGARFTILVPKLSPGLRHRSPR